MTLPLLIGDYATQLWQRPPSGVSQPLAYGPGGVILGSEETNNVVWVESADYVKLTQTGTYGSAKLARVRGSFRANAKQSDGTWRVLLRSGSNTEYNEDWSAYYRTGWEQRFDDLAINVTGYGDAGAGHRALQIGLYYVGDASYQTLPTACFSALQLEESTTEVRLINRFPSPSMVRVPHTLPTWRMDIADFTGNGVDLARTVVHINGYRVFDGSDVDDYTSSNSLVGPGDSSLRLILNIDTSLPAYKFISEASCRVSVSTYTVGGSARYEETYSFVLDDILAPIIHHVDSVSPTSIRVVWDDDMRADGSIFAADTIENYLLTPISVPAYTPTVTQIVAESGSSYLFSFDQELTFGAEYALLASSYVEDAVGNPVNTDGRERFFSAVTPGSMSGRVLRLTERVPAYNLDKSPGDLPNFLNSLQDSLDVLAVQVDRWSDILEPADAPVRFVDAMLADLGFPFFWEDASEERKRFWVNSLIDLYALKGTSVGIIGAIRVLLGINARIFLPEAVTDVWVLGAGVLGEALLAGDGEDPQIYSFTVEVDEYLSSNLLTRLQQVINYFKNAHEHLLSIISTVIDPPVEEGYWILGDETEGILGSTTVLYG